MPSETKTNFPTWDSMVADAHASIGGIETYQLPLGDVEREVDGETVIDENVVIEIPCPDGVNYIAIIEGQRRGDAPRIFNAMIPDREDRKKIIAKMQGVPYPIVDILTGKVLRHYYGLPIEAEEKAGNSPGS